MRNFHVRACLRVKIRKCIYIPSDCDSKTLKIHGALHLAYFAFMKHEQTFLKESIVLEYFELLFDPCNPSYLPGGPAFFL